MRIDDFFSELKRRNVYKIAVAYTVVGWLLIQVATQVFPFFEIPTWAVRLVVLAIIIGFPIALVIAWAFELTPEGLKRTEDVDHAVQTGTKSRAWIYVVILAALLSVGLFLLGRYGFREKNSSASELPAKSVAVLPFENLSDEKSSAYFADGIQDEIITKLAGVADLKVISRTSTAKYKSKPEDLKTVSQQLGVANVLEGTVQKAADKVRVNVQLIDARADSHLWAKSYDRDLKDVFAIQSEVAQEIVDVLRAKLSPEEAKTVASAPTKDPTAYDFFLKGEYEHRAGLSSQTPEPLDQAAAWYGEAIARDPNFALAIAQLAICRMRRHWLVEPLSERELTEAGALARQALTLAPDLAEAHIALGVFYYYGSRQYEPALIEFRRAIELQPNNSQALQFIGYVHRRQAEWERTLDELGKSLEHDPRNASIMGNLAQTHCILRRWKDAENVARHALTIDPHDATSMSMLLVSYLNQSGDAREAVRALATFPSEDFLVPNSGTLELVMGRRALTLVLNRDFKAALTECEKNLNATTDKGQRLSAITIIRVLAGDLDGAQADADEARLLLEARLREHPDEIRSMRALSWVYLALNRKEDAIKIARQALEVLPADKDAVLGTSSMAALAEIQARTGATRDAVSTIRRMLSIPAGEVISIARLKVDPVWDPIRNDPGFQELLTMKEHVGP